MSVWRRRILWAAAALVAALTIALGFSLIRHTLILTIERGEHEYALRFALQMDMHVIAEAVDAYARRTGHMPRSVLETLDIDHEASRALKRHVVVRLPSGSATLHESLVARFQLSLPDNPATLEVRGGVLVDRATGEEVQLLTLHGYEVEPFWRQEANILIWSVWNELERRD